MKAGFLALLVLALLPLTALGQQEYSVVLRGEPAECAAVLAGSGSYPAASIVTVEARASMNCKFVKWRVVKGLPYGEAESNPLIFQLNGDVELVAVFERLYEEPGGKPIERVLIYTRTNMTGATHEEPVVAMPGSEVRIGFERELYIGENKYVFLYATVDGRVVDTPAFTVKASPPGGRMNITGYYYTYRKFLGDYYPVNQFVKPEIEPVKMVSDGARLRAVGFKVGPAKFTLDQTVPRQLLSLVEPEYVKEYRVSVYADGASATVMVNGVEYRLNPSAALWIEKGRNLVIVAQEKLERHRLASVDAAGLAVAGNVVTGPVTGPVTVLLVYKPIPNAFLLDLPVAGPLLLNVADVGTALTGMEGMPALAAGLLVFSAPAAAASAAALLKTSLKNAIPRGRRARSPEVSAVEAAVVASLPHRSLEEEGAMRAGGRILLHPELKSLVMDVIGNDIRHKPPSEWVEDIEVPNTAGEAAEALKSLEAGGKASITPEHVAALECSIDVYDTLLNALEEGRLKIKGGIGYLGYDAEGARVERRLADGEAVVVVKSHDVRLGELVVTEACRRAGLSASRGQPPTEKNPKKAAEQLRKQAGGNKVLIHTHGDEEGERMATRASPLAGIQQVIVSQSPSLPAAIELPEPSKERYMSIAAAIAASKGLLGRLTHENIDYLADLAYSFRGVRTIEEAVEELSRSKEEPSQLLRQMYRSELVKAFTKQELELIMSHESLEELRSSYMAYVRQTKPGARPEREWSRMYERLRRVGIVG